jgi:putative hemolysin
MGGQVATYLVLIVIFIGLTAFFCSSETAFLALQKVRLEHLVSTDVKGAKLVAHMVEKPERLLSVVLFGINVCNTAAAALMTALAINAWGESGIWISTLIITVVILIFAETTPKTFAARHSEQVALAFIRPLRLVAWVFNPFVVTLAWVAAGIAGVFGGKQATKTLARPEEIRAMISVGRAEGTVEPEEARLLHKVFDFGDRPALEVMVPRPEVVAIESGATLAALFKLYEADPLSRFPVYKENMDNVVGVVSVKDVLMALARETATEESTVDELARPAYFAPETKHIDDLFAEMRETNIRLAVIVDEYGGTAGIVTLTRLVEEIVGEVGDELAGVEKDYEKINEYTFQVDGSMRIDEANEEMGLELPEEEDYETVAGFILSRLGHIPRRHEQLRFDGLKLVVTEMKGLKIESVLITKEKQALAMQRARAEQRRLEQQRQRDGKSEKTDGKKES